MKEVDVVYFIEHVARELDIACAVKYLCEAQWGISVHIASLPHHVNQVVSSYRPYVVALPYARFFEAEGMHDLRATTTRWQGARYIDLAFEQFLSPSNQEFKAPRSEFVRKEIYHHAWGEFYKSYLVKHGVEETKIIVNGNPSYELYQHPYCEYYPSRQELSRQFHLAPDRAWVFFPENYGWAFLSDDYLASLIKLGFDEVRAYAKRTFNRQSLNAVVRWWGQVARNLDCEIIVRPRPAIPSDLYVQAFGDLLGAFPERIHIIKAGTVREWILASDMVVSSYSTTLLEAAVAGRPAYMLEPYPFPEWLGTDWFDLLPHVRTSDELEAVCARPGDMSVSQRAREYVVSACLDHGDPIANLARILYELRQAQMRPAECTKPRLPQASAVARQRFHLLSRLACRLARLRGALAKRDQRPRGKGDHFDMWELDDLNQQDIERRTSRWSRVLGEQGIQQ